MDTKYRAGQNCGGPKVVPSVLEVMTLLDILSLHQEGAQAPVLLAYVSEISIIYILKCVEKGTATRSSILAWRIPWTGEPGGLQSMGSQRVRYNCVTNTFTFHFHILKYV